MGQFLYSQDREMFQYFAVAYGSSNTEQIREAISKVWSYASKAFVRSDFKHAATAVCGADPKGVFRAHELKTILNGKKISIKTINDTPLIHYRRVYRLAGRGDIGFYAAFMEVCKTELNAAQKAVASAPTPDEHTFAEEDYNARKTFFDLEQATHDPAEIAIATIAIELAAMMAGHSTRPRTLPKVSKIRRTRGP